MSTRGKGALLLLARLDSNRLPQKQLKKLNQEFTVLSLLVKRLERCKVMSDMIITTTNREVDQPLVDFAIKNGLPVFRGDVNNVAGRCLDAMKAHDLNWFIRICADSPLMDPKVVDLVATEFLQNNSDLTSNVFVSRDFPYGCSVEIVTREAMQKICDLADDPYYQEHVTAYAYKNPDQFDIKPVRAKENYSNDVQAITVDTAEDLDKAIWMVQQLDDPVYADLKDIVPLAEVWQRNHPAPK
ncbi:cytidylyltransferase domain-containing protein [Curvivirga sp.]|uniref:cytidylyltransferase domain-containing protein n=1 Tax=Curvivirga sp. TaxID=2856848 RepID=UPI003B5994F1